MVQNSPYQLFRNNSIIKMEKIDLKNLTDEEKEKILSKIWGFIKRHAPEVTADDFKRKKNESVSDW